MKTPGLVLLISALALSGGWSRAQPAPQPAAEARATIELLEAAMAPLRQDDYAEKDRRAALALLVRLQPQIAALQPPPAQAATPRAESWRKLSKDVDDAVQEENEFWTSRADSNAKLPSAEPLTRETSVISKSFSELFPRAAGAASVRGAATPDRASIANVPSGTTSAVKRETASGGAAQAHPENFFDGTTAGGSLVDPSAHGGGPGNARSIGPTAGTPQPDRSLPVEPAYTLHVGAVPTPAPATVKAAPARPHPVIRALNLTAPAAYKDAVAATPVLGAPLSHVGDAAEPPPAKPTAEVEACRQATGGGVFSSTCGSGYLLSRTGTLLAGVVDAIKDQFTGTGLLMNLAFVIGGLILGALTGGVGLIASIVRALCGIALLGTALAMLYKLGVAIAQVMSTKNDDVRHWQALREVGKIGTGLLIMVLAVFVGYKLGQKPPAKNAIGAMTEALESKAGGSIKPLETTPEMKGALGEEGAGGNRSNIKPPEPPEPVEPRQEPHAAGGLGLERTRPSLPPDEAALPKGNPKRISPREGDVLNANATNGENSAAKTLARKGYDVEQLKEIKGRSANPDYKIEGELFDCYTPQERTPPRNILETIRGKVPRQAERIVLNLDYVKEPDSLIAALKAALKENPIPKLKEIIVVHGGHVDHF